MNDGIFHKIGQFILWVFATIGVLSTAFWVVLVLFFHHIAIHH